MNIILLQAPGAGAIPTPILFLALGLVFYFFFIRPQNKQKKETQSLLENLKKGDAVITTGGLHGKIVNDNGTNFTIEIAKSTQIKVEKTSISMELTKALTAPKEEKKK